MTQRIEVEAFPSMLVVANGVTVSANKAVSHPLPTSFRAVATIGGTTPSFTFSLIYIPV